MAFDVTTMTTWPRMQAAMSAANSAKLAADKAAADAQRANTSATNAKNAQLTANANLTSALNELQAAQYAMYQESQDACRSMTTSAVGDMIPTFTPPPWDLVPVGLPPITNPPVNIAVLQPLVPAP